MLSLSGTPTQAKAPTHCNYPLGSVIDLNNRLCKDQNFKELTFLVYSLCAKVQKTNSVQIFQQYFSKTISDIEIAHLLKNLELKNEKSLKELCLRIVELNMKVQEGFPELSGNVLREEIIRSAAIKISKKFEFKKEAQFNPTCWETFLLQISACNLACLSYPDYWTCYEPCFVIASAIWGTCQLIES